MTALDDHRWLAPPAKIEARTSTEVSPVWRRALLGALFVALVLLMLRPGAHSLNHSFTNLGDPVFLTWALSWSGHAVVAQPLHLFDANIFWPHPLSLAYSESLFVLLPPFALVRMLGGSWALALNLVTLALLVLSLAATYSLTRWLTGRTDASLLAAIAYTFGGFTLAHLGHTQLMLLGFFPLGLLLLFRVIEDRSMRSAALLGVVNVAFLLGALYYAAVYAVCVVTVLTCYVLARGLRPGPGLVRALLITGAITLLGVPVLVPYFRVGQARPLVPELGLKPADLVTPAPGSILYRGLDKRAERRSARTEHVFFPGFSTIALAAAGGSSLLVGSRRRRRRKDAPAADAIHSGGIIRTRRIFLWLLIAAGGAAGVLALGPEVHGIPMPFKIAYRVVPGFRGIRATARLAAPAFLVVAVLAAVGFSALTRRLRGVVGATLAVAVGTFMLLELAAPMYWTVLRTDRAVLAVYRALAHKPGGAVLELPVIHPLRQGGAAWAYVEAPRMVYSTIDWKPRFNGYSGGWPDGYLRDLDRLDAFPSPESLAIARRLRIRYVVLHLGSVVGVPQFTDSRAAAIVAALPPGARAERHGNAWLVDLRPERGRP